MPISGNKIVVQGERFTNWYFVGLDNFETERITHKYGVIMINETE